MYGHTSAGRGRALETISHVGGTRQEVPGGMPCTGDCGQNRTGVSATTARGGERKHRFPASTSYVIHGSNAKTSEASRSKA